MSDTTTQPPAQDQETAGHGRHRGPVSSHEGEAAPRGRHRKPMERTETAA
ncbi:hypothetical protein STRCI_002530 [Streptomyces cinnabarinus]|uniref:Uncharacterized protein n=1 Tax=Streptomyces cinnabarinus TaxID=67287 RepID=A0ABY7KCL8_9ACTN|nr:hypothetical protein [Streptomyces cinnabarinus]WAZ21365.1 hypothetical protein STRCI_002530 [Streptomyces cinnabarinus]